MQLQRRKREAHDTQETHRTRVDVAGSPVWARLVSSWPKHPVYQIRPLPTLPPKSTRIESAARRHCVWQQQNKRKTLKFTREMGVLIQGLCLLQTPEDRIIVRQTKPKVAGLPPGNLCVDPWCINYSLFQGCALAYPVQLPDMPWFDAKCWSHNYCARTLLTLGTDHQPNLPASGYSTEGVGFRGFH